MHEGLGLLEAWLRLVLGAVVEAIAFWVLRHVRLRLGRVAVDRLVLSLSGPVTGWVDGNVCKPITSSTTMPVFARLSPRRTTKFRAPVIGSAAPLGADSIAAERG